MKGRNSPSIKIMYVLLLIVSFLQAAYAENVATQLSRDNVALGETFILSYTLNSNASITTPDFSALENDFNILNTNYGNAINMINGVTNVQTFWRLTLEAKRAGELIIPEINFGNAKSTARKISVDASAPRTLDNKQKSPIFVEGKVNTTTPYMQSQVVYTFKLFYQAPLENPRIEIPQIKDANFVPLGDGSNYQATVKGQTYYVVEKNFAFFAQKPGKVTITPFRFQAVTNDANASFSFNPFYITTPKAISLATPSITLNVRNTPNTFQGTTWLPAKNLELSEKWSQNSTQWENGNPVTRTIRVEAQGLRADQLPDLTFDKQTGVNLYVDPPKRSNRVQSNNVIGTLEQKVTYIPDNATVFTIPELKLNWWNLQTDANATAKLTAHAIQVKGTISPLPLQPVTKTATDMVAMTKAKTFPKIRNAPTPEVKSTPFYFSIWFWIAILSFAVWLITILFVLRKRLPTNKKIKSAVISKTLDDLQFKNACETGDANVAQQFLLAWAKKEYPDVPLNLEKLYELSDDEDFKMELKTLEQVLYAKSLSPWNGHNLLSAYKRIKKQKNSFLVPRKYKNKPNDYLPPLNP